MPDLPSVTNLINSPPGQLVAGAALAGIVWKFFERVEAVLTDQTKHEIARWLRLRSADASLIADPVEPWPDTFAKVFDKVFGVKHWSWKCFVRSSIASFCLACLGWTYSVWTAPYWQAIRDALRIKWTHGAHFPITSLLIFVPIILVTNLVPDYISLLESRYVLHLIQKAENAWLIGLLLVADVIVTCAIPLVPFAIYFSEVVSTMVHTVSIVAAQPKSDYQRGLQVVNEVTSPEMRSEMIEAIVARREGKIARSAVYVYLSLYHLLIQPIIEVTVLPAFFTSIWLWLYAGSGFLLKTARRFDLGFDWFNRKFDIEKKPLSAIGLVAGSLVAMLYWGWALFRHFVPA